MPFNHLPIGHACRKFDFIIILISVMNKCTFILFRFLFFSLFSLHLSEIQKSSVWRHFLASMSAAVISERAFWRLSVDSVTGKPWMIFHWSPETWLVNCRVVQVRNQRFINIKHILNSFCIVQARIIQEQNQ